MRALGKLIKKDGKVTLSDDFKRSCSMLKNGEYNILAEKDVKPRSLNQNALMWLWFACIEDETGTPRNQVHDHYCAKFLRYEITFNNKRETVVGKTRELSKEQFTIFLNYVQADAATEFGITLPLPDDLYYQEFIEQYKGR